MLNRIIFLFLLFPSIAMADGSFKILNRGYRAPYSGVLFDKNAVSSLLALPDGYRLQCDLDIEYAKDKLATEHKMQIKKYKADIEYIEAQNKIKMEGKALQIQNLQKELKKRTGIHKSWYIVGGFAAGVLSTTLIVRSVQ